VRTVPMDVVHYGERFERRIDPFGRPYYWATGEPPPRLGQQDTDLTALKRGFVTLTPLDYDMTRSAVLAEVRQWKFQLDSAGAGDGDRPGRSRRPTVKNRPTRARKR